MDSRRLIERARQTLREMSESGCIKRIVGLLGGWPEFLSGARHNSSISSSDAEFAPEFMAASLRKPSSASRRLLIAVSSFLVIAIVWASWATLDEVTTGSGKVIPSSRVQTIQNLEGGILKDILVHDGDVVEREQVLLRIDNTLSVSKLGELEAKYYSLLGAINRLEAEAADYSPTFNQVLQEKAPGVIEDEMALFKARKEELEAKLEIFRGKLDSANKNFALAKEEFEITKKLLEKGVVAKVEALRLERQVNALQEEVESASVSLDGERSRFRSEASDSLAKYRSELNQVAEPIFAARDRVGRTDVRSPVRGIVKEIKVRTVGGVIGPGMDLLDIVPLDDSLLLEAMVQPKDIAFILAGQRASVKVTAYDYTIYGALDGKVVRISADTIVDDAGEFGPKGGSYYKVIIQAKKNYLGTNEKPLPIIPGMVVRADIITGEKTVMNYLLKPINKARERALRER